MSVRPIGRVYGAGYVYPVDDEHVVLVDAEGATPPIPLATVVTLARFRRLAADEAEFAPSWDPQLVADAEFRNRQAALKAWIKRGRRHETGVADPGQHLPMQAVRKVWQSGAARSVGNAAVALLRADAAGKERVPFRRNQAAGRDRTMSTQAAAAIMAELSTTTERADLIRPMAMSKGDARSSLKVGAEWALPVTDAAFDPKPDLLSNIGTPGWGGRVGFHKAYPTPAEPVAVIARLKGAPHVVLGDEFTTDPVAAGGRFRVVAVRERALPLVDGDSPYPVRPNGSYTGVHDWKLVEVDLELVEPPPPPLRPGTDYVVAAAMNAAARFLEGALLLDVFLPAEVVDRAP